MILELAGTRFMAPYFGTSLYVWSSIIGVILGSLSLGYWLGGRISTLNPRRGILAFTILCAALAVLAMAGSKGAILDAGDWIANATDVRWGALFSALALFAVPNMILGIISPYAARLKIDEIQKSGREVGNLYAISTIGSIFGTFISGFWMIGILPAEQINVLMAATLAGASMAVDFKEFRLWQAATLAAAVLWLFFLGSRTAAPPVMTFDTAYTRYEVKDIKVNSLLTTRVLGIDRFSGQSLMNIYGGHPSDELVTPYCKYFLLGDHFNPGIKKTLMIGGGAYSFPKGFLKSYPEATIDVVEIDPGLTEISKKYFNLKDDARLTIINADGRVFLNQNKTKYDCVYIDAFDSISPPFHLATVEAARKIDMALDSDGAVLVNVGSSSEGAKSKMLRSMYATYKQVFRQVYVFKTNAETDADEVSNYVLVALKSTQEPQWTNLDPFLDGYLKTRIDMAGAVRAPVLTDDLAPVEKYVLDLVRR